MMVPHHQEAIDMAVAVLRDGKNGRLRRLAQEIIVTQRQEIAPMRLALGEPLPPTSPRRSSFRRRGKAAPPTDPSGGRAPVTRARQLSTMERLRFRQPE
jgi:hypothetical protein